MFEAAFLAAVILGAWFISESVVATLISLASAYGLVLLFEIWMLGSEERAERKLTKQEWRERQERQELEERAQARNSTQPVLERFVAEIEERHSFEESIGDDLPLEVIAAQASMPPLPQRPERVEPEPEPEPEAFESPPAPARPPIPEPEQVRERPPVPTAESAPQRPPVPEPRDEPLLEPREEPRRETERRSFLAEFASGQHEPKPARTMGGWNVWQLERMMRSHGGQDEQREYERSLLLVYLREFADSDGQLPPEFDELVRESFGDLVRGPSGR